MSQPTPTTVLITGADRGLGKVLLKLCLAKPNHNIIAGVRDPSQSTSQSLHSLPDASGSHLIIVKIDPVIEPSASDAVEELTKTHGIDHLDVVIANAGISNTWPKVKGFKIEDLKAHMEVNVYGVVWLYQATFCCRSKSACQWAQFAIWKQISLSS